MSVAVAESHASAPANPHEVSVKLLLDTALAHALKTCEPGSLRHVALLRESQRRRDIRTRMVLAKEPG